MAKRKKSSCLPKPKITLTKTKTPKSRKRIALPSPGTYVVCDTRDAECAGRARREGFQPARVKSAKPTKDVPPGFTFKSSGSPCSGKRFARKDPNACPVQAFWKGGEMFMRLCSGQGKKGRIIPLGRDAKKAQAETAKACRHWKKNLSWKGYAKTAPLGGRRR